MTVLDTKLENINAFQVLATFPSQFPLSKLLRFEGYGLHVARHRNSIFLYRYYSTRVIAAACRYMYLHVPTRSFGLYM